MNLFIFVLSDHVAIITVLLQKELDSIKVKKEAAAERLEKLTDTTNQIKKYYVKLKTEVSKSETEVRLFKTSFQWSSECVLLINQSLSVKI